MKKLNFLEKFNGILVHDHETALYHFGTDHGECNVHIIRYLKKNREETQNTWSDGMISLLCEMNKSRKGHILEGTTGFSMEAIWAYEKRYDEQLALGRKESKTSSPNYAREDEKRLLNRMEKYRHNHLLFLYDFAVPFDDNMSERDLRKAKNGTD